MNRNTTPIMLMLLVLVLATLACQLGSPSGTADTGKTPVLQTETQPTTLPTDPPQENEQPVAEPTVVELQEIRQWAVSATASSEYGESNWNAEQAIGTPDVLICEDNDHAWASETSIGLDWIELTYATPVIPTEINIHQSYNPSQVVEVDLIGVDGTTYTAWQGDPEGVSTCPDVMSITFDQQQEMLVQKVVVIVDQSVLGFGWNEIDAVELVGTGEAS